MPPVAYGDVTRRCMFEGCILEHLPCWAAANKQCVPRDSVQLDGVFDQQVASMLQPLASVVPEL
jgi:hypothetical protein